MKKLILFLWAASLGLTVHAGFLYWQVNNETAEGFEGEYNYASVFAYTGNDASQATALGIYDPFSEETHDDDIHVDTTAGDGVMVDLGQLGGDVTGYSFFIELYNYDASTWNSVARSQAETYASLAGAGYIDTGLTPSTPASVWHGAGYAIPEPTSGLLLLVGASLAALRKRGVKFFQKKRIVA